MNIDKSKKVRGLTADVRFQGKCCYALAEKAARIVDDMTENDFRWVAHINAVHKQWLKNNPAPKWHNYIWNPSWNYENFKMHDDAWMVVFNREVEKWQKTNALTPSTIQE